MNFNYISKVQCITKNYNKIKKKDQIKIKHN